jgi:DNA helicase-2/ATP-dependent DNA helicase PcrA
MPADPRQRYQDKFAAALDLLNAAQRTAVDRIEGPVMVLAGPGTGKTHLLAARIGRILLETDAQAHNILCLTFTDAGVKAMRSRLLQWIGPEAHRIHIYTFHGFCNGVIQDNLERFGRYDLEPLTDLERVELIRRLIDELDPHHPLKRNRTDPYFYERHLRDLFQTMQAEHWSVAYLRERIDTYLAELPERPEFRYKVNRGKMRKGMLKQAAVDEQIRRMDLLRAGVDLFPRYEELLRQARRYDYHDMIAWVIEAFETDEALLRRYQEQYLYLLVDEYQDTNGAQNRILRLLTDYWEAPNLFVVGDDDQSIYEFQGARLRNLTEFYDRYQPELDLILLEDNYRSHQPILDAASHLIGENEKRLVRRLAAFGGQKRLLARHPERTATERKPELRSYPNRLQEEVALVDQLRDWHAAGVPWREMAVIYARHRQADSLKPLLEKSQIPYRTKREVNVLDLPVIRQLRELLDYLARELEQPFSGEYLLFRLLHFRALGLNPADLAAASRWLRNDTPAAPATWRELLHQPPAGLSGEDALRRTGELLETTIGLVPELPVPALVERIFNRFGFLRRVLQSADRDQELQAVRTFFDFVRTEAGRRPRLRLTDLLETLRRLDANRIAIPLRRSLDQEDAVTLVTAHSAKGLEFHCVWLLDCTADYWENNSGGSRRRFALPDTVTLSGEEDALEARRRLFYVAMTRAKDHLVLSLAQTNGEGKDLNPSRFVEELRATEALTESEPALEPARLLGAEQLRLQAEAPVRVPAAGEVDLADWLSGFRLSVTALYRYLDCPLSFYYEEVLRAPQFQSPAATYGIALHVALQRYFDTMLNDPERRFPPAGELVATFEREMRRRRGYFPPREYERRLAMGRRVLADYHRDKQADWPRQVRTELRIRHAEVDGVPLTGTIDLVHYRNDREVRLVDYKTGRYRRDKLRAPTPKLPYGGNYWRQLHFYKLLFDNQPGVLHRATAATVSYLTPDDHGAFREETLRFEPEAVAETRQLIREVYTKIAAGDFLTGCGKADCRWCRFLREDVEVDSFRSWGVEELDD